MQVAEKVMAELVVAMVSGDESDLEDSSRLGEFRKSIGDRKGPKRVRVESPKEKELDEQEALRKMQESLEEFDRKVSEARELLRGAIEGRDLAKEQLNGAKILFEKGQGEFQVAGKRPNKGTGSKSPGKGSGKKDKAEVKPVGKEGRKIVGWNSGASMGKFDTPIFESKQAVSQEVVSQEKTQEELVQAKKPGKVPPITVRGSEDIGVVRATLKRAGLEHEISVTRGGDMKILTKSSDEYRSTCQLLKDSEVKCHWQELKEDRAFRVVVKGVPVSIEEEEVKEMIEAEGFKVMNVTRMWRNRSLAYDTVAVCLENSTENRAIVGIRAISGLRVRVEVKRKSGEQKQCYKCLGFGHVQYRCANVERCPFCAGEHHSKDCNERGEGKVFKCANCGGAHPAFFKSCPRYPQPSAKRAYEERKVTVDQVKRAEVKKGVSFADRVKPGSYKEPAESSQQEKSRIDILEDRLARIEAMLQAIISNRT